MSKHICVSSIGTVATRLQTTVQAVQRAAQAAGVKPSMQVDGVVYFDDADWPKLLTRQLATRASRSSGRAAAIC